MREELGRQGVQEQAGHRSRRLQEFAGCGDQLESALLEQCDASGEREGFEHIVRDEDRGDLVTLAQSQKLLLHFMTRKGVESAEGFIKKQQRRACGQCTRHGDALALAAGELSRVAGGELSSGQADLIEQLAFPLTLRLLGPSFEAGDERDVLRHSPVGQQAVFLDHVTDIAAQLDGIDLVDIFAIQKNGAGGGLEHAIDEAEGGGFS
jgi:hypothetical protein